MTIKTTIDVNIRMFQKSAAEIEMRGMLMVSLNTYWNHMRSVFLAFEAISLIPGRNTYTKYYPAWGFKFKKKKRPHYS